MPVVGPASPRLPQMAHRLPLFQTMAYRRHLGAYQPSYPRTPSGSLEEGSSAQCRRGGGFSGEVKGTAVGGEERGYDGGKKVKGRKRHILVDTEGFVLSRRRSTVPR